MPMPQVTAPPPPLVFTADDAHRLCLELEAYRIQHDLSFKELARAMRRTVKITIPPRTLHYLLTRQLPATRPYNRTIYKIDTFLAAVRPEAS